MLRSPGWQKASFVCITKIPSKRRWILLLVFVYISNQGFTRGTCTKLFIGTFVSDKHMEDIQTFARFMNSCRCIHKRIILHWKKLWNKKVAQDAHNMKNIILIDFCLIIPIRRCRCAGERLGLMRNKRPVPGEKKISLCVVNFYMFCQYG